MDEHSQDTSLRRRLTIGAVLATAVLVGVALFGARSDSDAQAEATVPAKQPAAARAPEPVAPPAYAAREPSVLREFEFPELLEPRSPAREDRKGTTPDDPDALDCLIEPYQTIDVGSPVIGLIEAVHVERSDTVEQGQPLVDLESGVERAALEVARARNEMDGQERAREASMVLGSKKEKRARQLYESSVLSLDLREETETAARLAQLELQQAREERRLASLQLAQAEEVLRRRTIRSPVSGVVVERLMTPGERVDEEVILRVAQIDPLRVEVTLPASRFGTVRSGMRAAVEAEVPSDAVYVASVSIVDRVVDAASGTFGVRLELPNPDHSIPSGLHCRVRFLEP